jgi:hypothetical protein
MKRVLLITAAILALSSCSKTTLFYEQTGEIYLTPVSENVTKSMMNSARFQGESFKVWSWFNPVEAKSDAISTFQAGFADQSTSVYVNEKDFVLKNAAADLWGGDVSYYWPNTGSLIFAGYHAPNLAENQVKYTFNQTENKMEFLNVNQDEIEATGYAEDIMYFNMTPSSYSNSNLNVGFEFSHALSWITVTLAKRVDPIIDASITIENVSFTNVAASGNGIVSGQNPISWTTTSTPARFDLPGLPLVIDYDTETSPGQIKTKIYTLKEHLFIPQGIKGLLLVKYTVESTDGAKFTETYPINIKTLSSGAHSEWVPGKHYTYNLSIGTDEILVTPSVDTWDPLGTDILIPLPDNMYPNS